MGKTQALMLNLLLLFSLVACSSRSNVASLLNEAEVFINEKTDSALILLDSVKYMGSLSKEQNALWCLLCTEAQDKSFITIASDSLINIAVNYFDNSGDPLRKAQAYYCQGRVFMGMLLFDKAIISFLKAEEFVLQVKSNNLQARIYNQLGDLYRKNVLYSKSLDYYRKANETYEMDNNKLGIAYTLRDIGLAYQNLEKLDSSLICLNHSLEIAKENNWGDLKYWVLICLANVYESKSLYQDAICTINQALEIERDETQLYPAYYSLGCLYNQSAKIDSACYYWKKALSSPDINIQNRVYRHFYLLGYQKKEFDKAFQYNEQYLLLRDSIERIFQPQKLEEVSARYNYERLNNEKNQLELKKEKAKFVYLLAITCLMILVFLCAILLYRKQLKIKENEQSLLYHRNQLKDSKSELEMYKISLSQKENELSCKEKEIDETCKKIHSWDIEKQEKLEEVIFLQEQISILQNKISVKEFSVKNMNCRFKKLVANYLSTYNPLMRKLFDKKDVLHKFTEKDWICFDQQLDFVYPGFIRNLKKQCPKMSDNEFRFCCMYLLGIKTSVIASALDLQPNTISKYVKDTTEKYFDTTQYDSLEENLTNLASKSIFWENTFWVDS